MSLLTSRSAPWVLGIVAAVAALASEAGRLLIKGQDYAFASFNDIHFYTAMVFNLWGDPVSVGQEVADRGFNLSDQEWLTFYGGQSDFWATHVHPENGLSHQPPWAYRIFIPTVAAGLRFLGIPLEAAFLIVYVVSAVLLVVSTFQLLRPYVREEWWAAAVSLGVLTAALAATSPGYPDMTFLGFAMLSVVFAYRQRGFGFALAGFAAGLTRETALLLIATWLALSWAKGSLNGRSALFASGPLLGVLIPRYLVEVPNSSTDYLGMLRDFSVWPQTLVGSALPLAVIGLVSPLLIGVRRPTVRQRMVRAEIALWVIGATFVIASGLLNLATSRMALLALPLFMAPVAWSKATSDFWLAGALAGTLGYALADTLAFRADPVLGQVPWFVMAALVLSLQLIARRRDKDRAGTIHRTRRRVSGSAYLD